MTLFNPPMDTRVLVFEIAVRRLLREVGLVRPDLDQSVICAWAFAQAQGNPEQDALHYLDVARQVVMRVEPLPWLPWRRPLLPVTDPTESNPRRHSQYATLASQTQGVLPMSFEHIKVVKSVDNDRAANQALAEGWQLLSVTASGEGMLYILGRAPIAAAPEGEYVEGDWVPKK